jgi:hypothetical protein
MTRPSHLSMTGSNRGAREEVPVMTSLCKRSCASIALAAKVALWLGLAWLGLPAPALAQAQAPTTVTISGGAQGASQTVPTGGQRFGVRVPLKPNAENVLSLSAADTNGRTAQVNELRVAQISLTDIVRATVTAQRLSTTEVKQLVAQGTINIADPDNYNVSRFVVALVVDGHEVQVAVPVARQKAEPMAYGPEISVGCSQTGQITSTETAIAIPCGDGGGSGSQTVDTPIIIPFEIAVPGVPEMPGIPGVILIEGRIKTLKEFFKVNLLLMNVSPLFTLTDLSAHLELPEGMLSGVAPAGGTIALADIGPGTDTTGQFIIRGDGKGTHSVTAHFGGKIAGAFLPEPVPFSGTASTDLEVKGPPKMAVKVSHPDYVTAGVPYDLTVSIENTDTELDALYTSLSIDVGAGAQLLDDATGVGATGPSVRSVGDILHGQTIVQRYRVMPLTTGAITSCVGAADENIQLSVEFIGRNIGCAIGTLPPEQLTKDGRPTVTVVPAHNTVNVSVDPAITALFSQKMIEQTVTTGYASGSFNVLDENSHIVGGTLTFTELFGATAAIFRPASPLAHGKTYTIVVNPSIFSLDGLALASGIVARFSTQPEPAAPDTQAPAVSLTLEPPLTAASIARGQTAPLLADATDAAGVVRVDLLLDDELIDAKTSAAPRFLVETNTLLPGTSHVLTARAFDRAGNIGTTSLTITIAPDVTPPTVAIVNDATVGGGRPLPVTVTADDDGHVEKVELYLDTRETPIGTGMVPPFRFAVATIGLSAGPHTLRAVVADGAGNVAEATSTFSIVVDATAPQIALVSPQGTRFRTGVPIAFVASATDDSGVASIEYRLDQELSPRALGASFVLDTRALALGPHRMTILAIDTSGNVATLPVAFEITTTPTDTTPPAPANTALITLAASSATGGPNAVITLTGAAGAVEASASVVVTNVASQAGALAMATAAGAFTAQIEAAGGQTLSLVVVDEAGNRSSAVTVVVQESATLTSIRVSPATIALSRSLTSQQLTVLGIFSDGSERALTSGLTFTSSAPSIASATSGGLVMPGQNGSAIVTVASSMAGVESVQVPITVNFAALTGITAEPNPLTITGVGRSQRLVVQARFSDGTTGPFSGTLRFGTANPNIAVVDGSGLVTSIAEGSTSITVSSNGLPSVIVLVVVQAVQPTALFVEPTTVAFTALDATQTLTVRYQYSDGSSGDGTYPVTFISADPSVATVSSAGVITARGEGTTTVAVQALTFSVSVPVSVTLPATMPAPEITTLGRPIAGEGDRLAILGRNFGGTPQRNLVTIGGLRADVVGSSFDRLIAVVPRGATSGMVQVRVAGQDSNAMPLSVYPRRAEAVLTSLPFDASPAQMGQTADLGTASFYVQPGDRLLLSGDPNTINGPVWTELAGPSFGGILVLTVNGVEYTYNSATQAIDLASLLPAGLSTPTLVTIGARLEASGTTLWSRGLALIAGPADTGAFVGERFLLGDTIEQQMVVRFRVAVPDGTKFAATAQPWYRLSDGGYPNGSAGGSLVGGEATPNDGGFRTFTAVNGEVAVTYSDAGVLSAFGTPGMAVVALLPADGAGNRGGPTPVAEAKVLLGALDSASVIPQQPSTLADGVDRPIAVDITGVRDNFGRVVTNGSRLAITAQNWYRRSDGGYPNESTGGILTGGVDTPNDGGFRTVTLMNGAAQVSYSAGNLVFPSGTTRHAVISVLPATPNGDRVGTRPFAEGSVEVSSASGGTAQITALPNQLTAAAMDNRSIITVSGLTDASGRLVPDGTRIAVTASNWYRTSDGGYPNGSFGGTILGGSATPNDGGFRTFTVSGGQISFTYSNVGLVLNIGETATTVISFLPADGSGNRLGTTPFADVRITQAGLSNATIIATPSSTLADGGRRPITIAVTNIVDALGHVVPDGTHIALTANHWYRKSDGGYPNNSAGGTFLDGTTASNDGGFFVYTVANGRVDATYSAETIPPLGASDVRSATIAAVVASSSGDRVTQRPFAEGSLAVSGIATGTVMVTPMSLLADRQDRRAVVSFSGLTDAQGRQVPNGSKVAMTATNWYRASDGGYPNGSAGGTMIGGATTPNNGDFRTYDVTDGGATASYSSAGLFVEPGGTAPAIVSVLTASPNGSAIGSQPFLTGTVTLTSVDAAKFVGPSVVSPGGSAMVTIANIRDSAGNLVPDGTRIAVTAVNWYNRDGSYPNDSAGGTITGGGATPNDGNFRTCVVSGGAITFSFTAPTAANVTAVLSAISADGIGNRNTHRPFASFAIRVQ